MFFSLDCATIQVHLFLSSIPTLKSRYCTNGKRTRRTEQEGYSCHWVLSVVVVDETYLGCILQSHAFASLTDLAQSVDTIPKYRLAATFGRTNPASAATSTTAHGYRKPQCQLCRETIFVGSRRRWGTKMMSELWTLQIRLMDPTLTLRPSWKCRWTPTFSWSIWPPNYWPSHTMVRLCVRVCKVI
jgi:hypothetical protein